MSGSYFGGPPSTPQAAQTHPGVQQSQSIQPGQSSFFKTQPMQYPPASSATPYSQPHQQWPLLGNTQNPSPSPFGHQSSAFDSGPGGRAGYPSLPPSGHAPYHHSSSPNAGSSLSQNPQSSTPARTYVPGFLSSSDFDVKDRRVSFSNAADTTGSPDAMGQSPRSPFGGPMKESTPSRTGRSQSSTASLFNQRSRKAAQDDNDDLPPTKSLDDYNAGDSVLGSSQTGPHDEYFSSPQSNDADMSTTQDTHAPPIIVYGFQPPQATAVVEYFAQHGEIISQSFEEGCNWVTIIYKDGPSALRAVRRNGEVIGGQLMVGVKWAQGEPSALKVQSPQANGNGAITSPWDKKKPNGKDPKTPARPATAAGSLTPGNRIMATPMNVVQSSDGVFKQPDFSNRQKSSSFFNLGRQQTSESPSKSVTAPSPHARIFANRDEALKDAQPLTSTSQGLLGRFGEIVFGS